MTPKRRSNGQGSLFKRNGRGAWIARWYDHDGKRRERSTSTTDKAASQRILNKFVADTALRREGVVDAKSDKLAEQARRLIGEHLNDFKAALAAKGSTAEHVGLVYGRAQRVINGCGFQKLADVSASRVMEYIHGLRADVIDDKGDGRRGISAQTFNFYLQAVKQFCRWLVKDRRAADNPLAHLGGLNVKTDRRHDRRALSVDEMRRLLHAVRNGPDRTGRSRRMTGPERAILYQLAMETGFRSSELRSLVRASFDLDGAPPPWRWKPGTASEDGVMFYPFCNRRPNCSGPFWLI